MLQSQFFTKTSKTAPEGEETKNAELLIRGGFIHKTSAGVYTLLPLGLLVLNRITTIIREEMNAIGGEELLMPALIDKKYWQKSNRWETDVIYRTGRNLSDGKAHDFEYGLGWTHEEVIAAIAVNFIQSYRDLPKSVYQIQNKFRGEVRAQGGLLRGREFLMKDLYSFHADTNDLNRFYEAAIEAYRKIFQRLGLKTLVVEASGGAFTKDYTHEFQVLNPAGEDTVHYCSECDFAQNKEVFDAKRHTNCAGELKTGSAIEVGNVFRLGTKFSDAFGLSFTDKEGNRKPVVMGSYGIGPTRVMGTLVEVFHDERGIRWPESVSPFAVHLIELPSDEASVTATAKHLYDSLQKRGIRVLYDDRAKVSVGEKFADADLLGIPYRAVVGEKNAPKIELKKRSEEKSHLLSPDDFLATLSN